MIGVHVRYRGVGSERWRLAAVPVAGSYIIGPGAERRLYQVAAVVLDGDQVGVYCVEVSALLASELQAAWAGWGEASPAADEAPWAQRGVGGWG